MWMEHCKILLDEYCLNPANPGTITGEGNEEL